jgi:hypothetical protein
MPSWAPLWTMRWVSCWVVLVWVGGGRAGRSTWERAGGGPVQRPRVQLRAAPSWLPHPPTYLLLSPPTYLLLSPPLPGEAYDKVARLLGLDLRPSGGAALEAFAAAGDPDALPFSVPMLRRPTCDFSYAGLKTAVRLAIEERCPQATGGW